MRINSSDPQKLLSRISKPPPKHGASRGSGVRNAGEIVSSVALDEEHMNQTQVPSTHENVQIHKNPTTQPISRDRRSLPG